MERTRDPRLTGVIRLRSRTIFPDPYVFLWYYMPCTLHHHGIEGAFSVWSSIYVIRTTTASGRSDKVVVMRMAVIVKLRLVDGCGMLASVLIISLQYWSLVPAKSKVKEYWLFREGSTGTI